MRSPPRAQVTERDHLPHPWIKQTCHSRGQSNLKRQVVSRSRTGPCWVKRDGFPDSTGERMNQTEWQIPATPFLLSCSAGFHDCYTEVSSSVDVVIQPPPSDFCIRAPVIIWGLKHEWANERTFSGAPEHHWALTTPGICSRKSHSI